MGPISPVRWRSRDTIDEMLAAYVDWREQSDLAREAYIKWAMADSHDSPARFAAFLAALDGEELLAKLYAAVVSEVTRLMVDDCLVGRRQRRPRGDERRSVSYRPGLS